MLRNGWNSRMIQNMLMNRTHDALENLKATKAIGSQSREHKFNIDYYCALFRAVNYAWMHEKNLISRRHMILGLQQILAHPIDPDEEAIDPGRFQSYWEMHIRALIAEFESMIYRYW